MTIPLEPETRAERRDEWQPQSRSMVDVFAGLPGDSAQLVASIRHHVHSVAPIATVSVPGFEHEAQARPLPYVDSLEWSITKSLVQLVVVAAVVMFVVRGGADPVLATSYVATSLLLMLIIAVADRARFDDRDPSMTIVEFFQPAVEPVLSPAPRPVAPLVPLVEQMHAAMPERVDVT